LKEVADNETGNKISQTAEFIIAMLVYKNGLKVYLENNYQQRHLSPSVSKLVIK
jgi:hypothetical protein